MNTTTPHQAWQLAHNATLSLDQPRIMGILNVTPDSFSDGGELPTPAHAVKRAHAMLDEGADLLDIGGESTRPGSDPVPAKEQINRTIPAIDAIRNAGIAAPISIDTTSSIVAAEAIAAGANIINDVSAATHDADMLTLAAKQSTGIILMHRLRPPHQDSYSHQYENAPDYSSSGGVTAAVAQTLKERASAAQQAGISPHAIVIDPGLGFGKTAQQNYELIANTHQLASLNYPILAASSRKSFIGHATNKDLPNQRAIGSVAAAVAQVLAGAVIVRCHDITPHAEALKVTHAILTNQETGME